MTIDLSRQHRLQSRFAWQRRRVARNGLVNPNDVAQRPVNRVNLAARTREQDQ